jgi:hypothetical protein
MATHEPSIAVKDLSYKFQDGSEGLEHVTLDLPAGSRTLLIGGTSYPYTSKHSSLNYPSSHPILYLNSNQFPTNKHTQQTAPAKPPSSASSPANGSPQQTP